MLYKKKEQRLTEGLFKNPTNEYRGAPFWAWNNKLDERLLLKELDDLMEMGMGGAHIHCRVGLDTPYLGDEFFELVTVCKEKMKKNGMLCWLYDEDRWPSGSAGGLVTKDEKYRLRFLVFEPEGQQEKEEDGFMSAAKAVRGGARSLLGRYRVSLDKHGNLASYSRILEEVEGEDIWCVWLEVSGNTPWFNHEAYVNALDNKAVSRFVEVTHEQYYKRFAKDFGNTIPAIFTDEPQTCHKEVLGEPFEKKPVILPYTDDFEDTCLNRYGLSVLEHLPELIWELPGGRVSRARYLYHRHLCERFSEAFGDQVGRWCENHHIALTGHMMNEWTLYSQTMAIGEVMRPLKSFTLPGMDMLCDRRELSTAKQVQSIARQMGREGVMSEIYGVTGWAFDFRNHKLAGDWQAALGVTVRVPHLSWVSMEGEAKRDYPASIGYQSPWYREYSYIENHFARLNTALTRGKPRVAVAVIHPIESYWMHWGNQRQTAVIRKMLEDNFEHLIEWLLFGLIDFDFISESVLEDEKAKDTGDLFQMGEMRYQTVIVPGCRTLRKSTYEKLSAYANAGGSLVFMGETPQYLDGGESRLPSELAERCNRIEYNEGSLLEYLEPFRHIDVSVKNADGEDPSRMYHRERGIRADNLFYQMREDGEHKWLFLCHVNKPEDEHITDTEELKITIKGEYSPIFYNTLTGMIQPAAAVYQDGNTIITAYASAHDSLLFELLPGRTESGIYFEYHVPGIQEYLPQPKEYVLEEPNCCLLDQAEYAFDSGVWQEREELLRIDNLFREKLGYPLRMEALAQPWLNQEIRKEEHLLKLRFKIQVEMERELQRKGCCLAMEGLEKAEIFVNGIHTEHKACGWYVDESIRMCRIPSLRCGVNTVELHLPFGEKTNVEWCYLLGEFGVRVMGREVVLTDKPKQLYFGDFVNQGLPFYAGNLVYTTEVHTDAGELWLEASHYRGALLQVRVDEGEPRPLIFAPYRVNLGRVCAGEHKISIRVFGNRINAFGAVHHADAAETWYGPNLWRTRGAKWSYEYQLEEMGVLTTPRYWVEKQEG